MSKDIAQRTNATTTSNTTIEMYTGQATKKPAKEHIRRKAKKNYK